MGRFEARRGGDVVPGARHEVPGRGTDAVELRAAGAPALVVPATVVVPALEALAVADDASSAALAVLGPLVALDGVRAGAVVSAERARGVAVVVGSLGYDCGVMAAGAELPLDAGLPVTEAVRRAEPVLRGPGPSWVALPVGSTRPRGGLLLSLDAAPPAPESVEVLGQLAGALGRALDRVHRNARRVDDLEVLVAALAATAPEEAVVAAARARPFAGGLSGDVVEVVDLADATWALVADVAGRGAPAAVPAHALRASFRAVAPLCGSPGELLRALDRALPASDESFVTALALRFDRDGGASVASAGHPAPLVLRASGRVDGPLLRSAPPLGCGLLGHVAEAALALDPGDLLLAWTDGLVDRRPEVDLRLVLRLVSEGLPAGSRDRLTPHALADLVLAACDAAGPAEDDVSLLALAPSRVVVDH